MEFQEFNALPFELNHVLFPPPKVLEQALEDSGDDIKQAVSRLAISVSRDIHEEIYIHTRANSVMSLPLTDTQSYVPKMQRH
jgi:hypothetical protein